MDSAAHFMEVALRGGVPLPLTGSCVRGRSATYIVIVTAAAICILVVQLCEAYYH
jgi:hypothetical protein